WGNGSGSPISSNTAYSTVSYSIIQGGHSGNGNISADPRFVNAAEDNLNLLPCSPAINAGNNTYLPVEITVDMAFPARRYASGPDDRGADDYQAAPGVPLPSAPSPQSLTVGPKVADLTAAGCNIEWFEQTTGSALNPSTVLSSGTYYVGQ